MVVFGLVGGLVGGAALLAGFRFWINRNKPNRKVVDVVKLN
jgi:hypothetical protein